MKQHIIALDLLRTLLAICVMLFHFGVKDLGKAFLSVDIFFILSGFVLSIRYFDDKNITFTSFAFDRFVRIYPLFFIACVLSCCIHNPSTWHKVSSLFLVQMLNLGTDILGYPFPSWSLSVEIWIGILVFWPIFANLRYTNNVNQVMAMFALIIYGYIYYFNKSLPNPFDVHVVSNSVFTMGELRCIAGLLLGYSLYFVYRAKIIEAFSAITINITTLLLIVVTAMLFSGKVDDRIFLLATPLLIITLSSKKCLLNRCKGKVLGVFAKMSYSVYLFHQVVWDFMAKFNIAYFNILTKHQQQVFASVPVLLICIPITIYIEPFLIKKTRAILLKKFGSGTLSKSISSL